MKYDKINFLYRTPASEFSSDILYKDLENSLKRNGLLYYTYDVAKKDPLDMKKLLSYPILCINGSWEPVFSIVKSISNRQFLAEINSEPLFRGGHYRGLKKLLVPKLLRVKKYFKILKSSPRKRYKEFFEEIKMLFVVNMLKDHLYPYRLQKERSKYINLYFSGMKEDLDKYFGKPCYWFAGWPNTDLLNDIAEPISEKILFFGAMHAERLKFFEQDKNKIIEIRKTVPQRDHSENVKELCKLINEYKYGICPMGIGNQYVPGKVFEYLACKRLCFCFLPENNNNQIQQLFEDGKEIVYFKSFSELEEKYRYYLKNSQKADLIAKAGYDKIRKYHTSDARAKRFAEIVLYHANGGKYNESFNNISLFGGKLN